MRIVIASVLAATLAVSTAMAGDANSVLPAGKPAGVHQAELSTVPLVGLIAVAALVGVVVGITSGGSGYTATPVTVVATTTTTA